MSSKSNNKITSKTGNIDNLKKTKDLLKGLILHQDEIGMDGKQLMYLLLAAGIEPSYCKDQKNSEKSKLN